MADRPSANRVPLAEIHLRCTSAKEFRRKKLMRIKERDSRQARALGNEGEYRRLEFANRRASWEKSDLYSWKCIRITHPAPRPALISGTYRFISRVIDKALRYLQTTENAAVNIHNSNRSVRSHCKRSVTTVFTSLNLECIKTFRRSIIYGARLFIVYL